MKIKFVLILVLSVITNYAVAPAVRSLQLRTTMSVVCYPTLPQASPLVANCLVVKRRCYLAHGHKRGRLRERGKVWAFTAGVVKGRVALVAGIAGNNTAEVVNELKAFDTTGYDAILSASPAYNKPTQEGIYQHYKLIAENSPLPVILYNVPGRTGSNMTAETTVRLARDFKQFIGIKEASGNMEQVNVIMRDKPAGFLMISGDDPITLPMIALGAVGAISVIANALPRQTSDMVRLCLDNQFAAAQPAHFSLLEFTRLCFAEGSPAGVKVALKELGICGDAVRLPLVQVSAETADKMIVETRKLK